MALAPKDIPLTREMVTLWLTDYEALDPKPEIKTYLASCLNNLGLPDLMVNTQEHEGLNDQTSLLEMIVEDLPSYGF